MACDGVDGTHLLAFFLGGILALIVAALVRHHVTQRVRKKSPVQQCKREGAPEASKDLEKGRSDHVDGKPFRPDVADLCEKIRMAIESETAKGLAVKELELRLSSFLKLSTEEASAAPSLRESATPTPLEEGHPKFPSKGSVDTRTPSSSNRSGSTDRDAEELPGVVALPPTKPGKEPLPPPAPPATLESLNVEASGPPKMLAPTERQNAVDPPEKCHDFVDEDEAQRHSTQTLQRILSKRDAQTTELHRQLRDTRQQLWQQTAEARAANARLHACLADASRAPQEQAEAIVRLQSQEQQWACIAKRQRAYLQQSERLSQEGLQILRRHPAGELFLAAPPVFLEGEEEEDNDAPVWDVGTSHCNPYTVDSWPFEPNVLAARASVPPNLNPWGEGGDEDLDDVGEDLGEDLDEDEDPARWRPWDEHPDEMDEEEAEEDTHFEPRPGMMKVPVGRGATLPPLTVPVGGSSARSS